MHEILVGRSRSDLEKYGKLGMGFIARHLVGAKKDYHATNPILVDLARPHLIGLFGKRGQGKSYSMGVIAEELLLLPEDVRKNLSGVIIDTMGIYWSMKHPNDQDAALLREWGLEPRAFDVRVLVPEAHARHYYESGIPFDGTFSLRVDSLDTSDWLLTFDIEMDSEMGIILQRAMRELREEKGSTYTMEDIMEYVKKQPGDPTAREGLVTRFMVAQDWGLFSEKGLDVKDIVRPGEVSIVDISHYTQATGGWSVRALVVGLLARKILDARIKARRLEEEDVIEGGTGEGHMPIVWMLIDEAHQFLPSDGMTPASIPLLQWVKIGREPGVSMVLATQMPNKLHPEAISQCDLVISHRLTSSRDLESLSTVMATYMKYDIPEYFDLLPRVKGAALFLDDNSEKIIVGRTRPRMSWHAGGTPIAIKRPPEKVEREDWEEAEVEE